MIEIKQFLTIKRIFIYIFLGILFSNLFTPYKSFANSFVGNGGSTADVEMLVTKKQIYESLKKVNESEVFKDYCECIPVYNNRNICAPLENLDSEQRNFCTLQLKNVSGLIVNLLEDPNLVFNWTNKVINLQEGSNNVTADAVANPETKIVTVNKKNFLMMTQYRRVFLIAHELLHLVPIEGEYIGDVGDIGPFKSQQGRRELINSMASETVLQVYRYGLFQLYKPTLLRGQSNKHYWLDLNFVQQNDLISNSNTYSSDKHYGFEVNYKHFIKKWGFNFGYKSLLSSEKILTSIEVEHNLSTLGLGLSYRFFMDDDPLTAFGQSFMVINANVDLVVSEYDVKDPFVSSNSKDNTIGYSVQANYYYPLDYVWVKAGIGLSSFSFAHEELNLDKESLNIVGQLGVSYGF